MTLQKSPTHKVVPMLLMLCSFLLLSGTASAVFCDEEGASWDCDCRKDIILDDDGDAFEWTDIPDVKEASEWFNTYCLDNQQGIIKQRQTTLVIQKPACLERVEVVEYRRQPEPLCKKCPEPELISSWRPIQCFGDKTVYQRDVIASFFTPGVEECDVGRYIELEIRDEGSCSSPITAIPMAVSNNGLLIIGLLFVALVVGGYLLLRKKK